MTTWDEHRTGESPGVAGRRPSRARRYLVGLATAAGSVLAFGMVSLTSAPTANADFDDLVGPIANAISQAANAVTGDSPVAPALAAVQSAGSQQFDLG